MTRRKSKEPARETGFTLIEVIVAITVIAILAGISFSVYNKHQRTATDATVKSDVVSNRNGIISTTGAMYKNGVEFTKTIVSSNTNTIRYTWSADQTSACVWASHEYSPQDVTSYYYSTLTGKIGEGECENLNNTIVFPPNTSKPSTPSPTATVDPVVQPPVVSQPVVIPTATATPVITPTSTPTVSPTPTPTVEPAGTYTITRTVTENFRTRVCFAQKVETTSVAPIPYQVEINTNEVPFMTKTTSAGYDLHEGRIKWFNTTADSSGILRYTGTGALSTVSAAAPLNLTLCIPQYNAMVNYYPANISRNAVNGNQWYATQRFTITSQAVFYTNWGMEVDLTELKNTVSGKPNDKARVNDSRVKLEWVRGNIYKLSPANSDSTMRKNDSISLDFAVG